MGCDLVRLNKESELWQGRNRQVTKRPPVRPRKGRKDTLCGNYN